MVCFNPEIHPFAFGFRNSANTCTLFFIFLGYFYISESLHRDCEVRLRTGELDYETMKNYKLDISLQSHKGLLNENRVKTQVRLLFNFGSEYFLNCRNFFQ